MPAKKKNYVRIGEKYRDGVLSGKIDAGIYVILACQRQRDDLKKGVKGFTFNHDAANKFCHFAEQLPIVKGGKGNIILKPWACFVFTTIFGWVDDEGNRRYRNANIYVPKKNAKSTFAAVVALYGLMAEGEKGAEIYSAATKKDQAKIVWDIARAMVDQTPLLRKHFGCDANNYVIFHPRSNSKFIPLSKDRQGSNDGYDVHMGIIDEIHALVGKSGAAMYEIVERGTIARTNSLILGITTAGGNLSGVGWDKCQYGKKLLEKKIKDEGTFFIFYGVDDEDVEKHREELFTKAKYWKKANPNWDFINEKNFRNLATKAKNSVSEQAGFMTKHLNVFIGSTSPWINMLRWDALARDFEIDDFKGCGALIGVDLATKKDICSAAILIFGEDGKKKLITRHYINEERAKKENNARYWQWVQDGDLIETPGGITDYRFIEADILEICKKLDVEDVIFDPHQAAYIETNLDDAGIEVSEWPQTMQYMSEPSKIFDEWITTGEIEHDNNQVMNWMVSNTQLYKGPHDQQKPVKESKDSENKIDGVVATIFTVGRHSLITEDEDVDDVSDLIDFG
jgi:phage terminase large subunit-like protein